MAEIIGIGVSRRQFLGASLSWLGATQSLRLSMAADNAPITILAKPDARQIEYMDLELGVFLHYGINTYSGQEHGDGKQPASLFNPSDLNAEQWVLTTKALGAKYCCLTARHEEGFCLWPTKTTDYSIKSSPYKQGQGDIVGDFVAACRQHSIRPCLYFSPGFDAHDSTPPWAQMTQSQRQVFTQIQVEQITELLTQYGPLFYLWFDHWDGRNEVCRVVTDTVRRLQPGCLMLGPDIWVTGTESGHVAYPLWNATNTQDGTAYSRPSAADKLSGEPSGKFWRPRECDTNTGFSTGGWFWHPSRTRPKPLAEHVDLYYRTVGLGANTLIDLPPDQRGLIPEDLVTAARDMNREIERLFSHPVAQSKQVRTGNVVELSWKKKSRIDHVVLMENVAEGQKVAAYTLEARIDNQWQTLKPANHLLVPAKGYNADPGFETIGHKKIDRIEPLTTHSIRFRCLRAVAQPVQIGKIAVYDSQA